MISHEHRCIFVHLPRCAGTSIERWIVGADWWQIEPATKHLIASQARRRYAQYWDDYFKFTIVRNPADRIVSCLKYPDYFGIRPNPGGSLDFDGYFARFRGSDNVILEHDHRFTRREDLLSARHRPGAVYGNMLDEELDFVATFDTLAEDGAFIRDRLQLARALPFHEERTADRARAPMLTEADATLIDSLFQEDRQRFNLLSAARSIARR